MPKKLICTFFIFIFTFSITKSQSFMHGFGATISLMTANISTPSVKYTATVAFTNLTYFPRYTLTESDRTSVSIGAPVGAGVGFSTGGGSGDASVYYGFDIPVVIDYNIGRKSTMENEESFGWYVGTGFGYQYTNWTDGYSNEKLNSYGPLLRAGIRFGGGFNHPDRATTVGLSFKPGLEKSKFKTFGIAVLTEF